MDIWLPTELGKRVCYQALPFVMEHKTEWLCYARGGTFSNSDDKSS